MSVGTLGGPATFAGQATSVAAERYPDLGEVRYLPSMEAVWAALAAGDVDVVVATAETTRTGFTKTPARLLRSPVPYFVVGEVAVPYRCMLLGRPGSSLDRVDLVLGHGSLEQCRGYLARRLPRAATRRHEGNSVAAAEEVRRGDGTTAVVGTRLSAEQSGLTVLAEDVDEGSIGMWWLVARSRRLAPEPEVVVVLVRAAEPDALRQVLARARDLALLPRGIATVPTGSLHGYGHVVVLAGRPPYGSVADLTAGIPGCRVAGAF